MKIEVIDFVDENNKIKKEYLCSSHNGKNICPNIKWTKVDNAKSYLITMVDPDTPSGETFIHLILYVNDCCELNNSKNYEFGLNSLNEKSYHGPCAPKNSGVHRYIFSIYAYKENINNKNVEKYFPIDKASITFTYSHPSL